MRSTKQISQQSAATQPNAQVEAKAAFTKHLEQASALVQSWPAWKQQVLGSMPASQQSTASDKR